MEDICLINFVLEIKDCFFYTSLWRIIIHTLQTIIMIVHEFALVTALQECINTSTLLVMHSYARVIIMFVVGCGNILRLAELAG